MFGSLVQRLKQGHRTVRFPSEEPVLPDRFRGRLSIDISKCQKDCSDCAKACPTNALVSVSGTVELDLGRCIFCGDCEQTCSHGALQFTRRYELAANSRSDLASGFQAHCVARALGDELRRIFGRSLRLRQVSAGGCNACEADTNVLNTVIFDLARFGIQFVASPRHADGLLVTGPVSQKMKFALEKTWEAIPEPKLVIAVGACAIAGGPFAGHREVIGGIDSIMPVDLYIPGCPPHPYTILDGLLRLLGKR